MNLQQAEERGMGKGLIVSVTLHVIVIALLIVCSGGHVKEHPETITVFLQTSDRREEEALQEKTRPVSV